MNTLISVIMPVHNTGDAFLKNFGNLVYQSLYEKYGDGAVEIILIDDASTDNTPAVVDSVCAQFPARVKGFHLRERLGPGSASNFGCDNASGVCLSFMNPYDIVDASFYETLYAEASKSGFLCDYTDSPVYIPSTEKTHLTTPKGFAGELDAVKKSALLADAGLISTKIFRTDFIRENNIRLREHSLEDDADEDFVAEVICLAGSVAVSEKPLYVKNKKEKAVSPSRMSEFTKRFSTLVSSCMAVYGRLSSFPGYEDIRQGAETFYLKRLAMALRLYERGLDEGVLATPMDEQLLNTLRLAADTVIRTPLDENPYAARAVAPAAKARLNRYIGV